MKDPSSFIFRLADGNGASAAGQLSSVGKRLGNKEHVLLKVSHTVALACPEVKVVPCVD